MSASQRSQARYADVIDFPQPSAGAGSPSRKLSLTPLEAAPSRTREFEPIAASGDPSVGRPLFRMDYVPPEPTRGQRWTPFLKLGLTACVAALIVAATAILL
jgi:hypothetical protein